MLYFRCPSCKYILARVQIPYETAMDAICHDAKLTDKEKDKLKGKVLDNLGIPKEKYCCRMRIMGYVRLIDEIV
jgi:DNA-directed RNA polymerase subunit N (RpoN/RPB10)